MEMGPVLSPASPGTGLPVAKSALMSLSAQLRGLVCTRLCAVLPEVPPSTGVTDRVIGYAVITLNPSVIGCAG